MPMAVVRYKYRTKHFLLDEFFYESCPPDTCPSCRGIGEHLRNKRGIAIAATIPRKRECLIPVIAISEKDRMRKFA